MLKTQIVDVSRSAIITDPEAFYENLMATGQEDAPEKTMPIVAYEGYNFLPTVYGYRSYFDVTSKIDIAALPSKCDKLINFQLSDYSNFLLALTEDGIYTNPGKVSGASWTLAVAKTAPGVGQYKEWTCCVIENKLYMYRQGDSTAHVKTNVPASSITTHTPTFLNMSGQMGIFRANGRLGFWDSANSISWSSVFDLTDFTPSIETLAGNVIFNDVLGRIVSIKASGSGFVIYSTKNIVGASYSTGGSILFDAHTIAETAGIWSSKQVCTGVMDTEHYAYTNTGIKHISNAEKVENVFAPIYDFLKEARDPVYLDFLQGRYLFINVINPAYIDGYVTFAQVDVPEYTVRLKYNDGEATTIPVLVDGIPLADKLISDIVSGLSAGMYAQWGASGSKLIPSRSPSSMSPYQVDDPFTPADDYPYAGNSAVLYSNAELIDARDNGTWTNKFSVNNAVPFALDLGWHNAPLGTGRTDSELTRIKSRQIGEWNEYYALVKANTSAISALGTSSTLYHDPIVYAPGTAPTYPTVDSGYVEIGVIPDPSRTINTEAFSGVSTYTPSYEYKNSYVTEFPIQRRVYESHYGVELARAVYMTSTQGGGVISVSESWITSLAAYTGWTITYDNTILSLKTVDGAVFNDARWIALKNQLAVIYPVATTITHNSITHPVDSVVVTNDSFSSASLLGYYRVVASATNNWGFGVETKSVIYELRADSHGTAETRTKNTTKTLTVGTHRSCTPIDSILSANQEILDWAIYTFDWDTNQQVVGSDIPFILSKSLPPISGVTYPGATFLLQDASPAAIFPDFAGSLVYDTYLQKWGKMKATFRALLDYSPLNSNNNGSISYSNFGLDAGILTSTGLVKLFSSRVSDSKIRYGKFAMSRQGFTALEYIDIKFRKPFTGTITLDTSLDGRSIHSSLTQSSSFVGVGLVTITPEYSGRWFIITVIGEFDLRSIEFTGRPAGIR